ncbi:MAG TPA: DUF2232 domain-containing protein [Pseudolabrys sp.]|nr:DUF2232 domain-containing protein [Pseudolabrys sp.]
MIQIAIIGIGAGAAAALLFASVISGSWLSIPLFYLAPLPIMIAGLGWSHWAAMTAAIAGAIGLGAVFGTVFLLAFAAGAGFPAWCLGYLAMLARPVASTNGSGQGAASFEWYPPGRLVVWAAVLGVLVVIVAIPNFGIDADSFRAGLRDALNAIMRVNNGTPTRTGGNTERLLEILVNAIPPAAAVLATITNLLNLWLAARVVKFSGRLARPWPQLSSMTFPPLMTAALGVAIILSFLDGMLGIVGGIVAASLLLAYGVLGFAVLHAITQGMSARSLVLGITYAGVFLLGWPMLALCLLGLIDTAIGLRGRVSAKRGPPTRS